MSAEGLDPVIHPPTRLAICAFLASVDEASFVRLAEVADVSDSVLSKHLSALVASGYVEPRKATTYGRARTWARLTPRGREAFEGHVRALLAMVTPEKSSEP